jgi:hypothetical protein
MDLDPVAAYVTVVSPDRTIRLPADVPVGATVAVVLLTAGAADEASRRERFERTRAAVRAAERAGQGAEMDDPTLDALIEQARRS